MSRNGWYVVDDLDLVLAASLLHKAQASTRQAHEAGFHDQALEPSTRFNFQLLAVNVDRGHLVLLAGVETEKRQASLGLEDKVREGTDHLCRSTRPGSSMLQQHSALRLVALVVGLQGGVRLAGLVAEAALERANSNGALLVSLVVRLEAALLCELVSTQLARVRLLTGVNHRVGR